MKKLLIALAASGLCLSFAKKEKAFIPPGTIQINDTLFADEAEISNLSWLEYEHWTKAIYGTNSKEHIATLPDTTVWRAKDTYNEPYVQYYYRHPAYKDYPVVGITYDQAQAYCKWRTERIKMFLSIKKDFRNQNFEYRLPSKTEWERLAESSAGVLTNFGRNKKGEYQLNCTRLLDTLKNNPPPYPDVIAPVYSYHKNWLGLYNMVGNVSEMVKEKGISKGGSWRNNPEDCRPGKDHTYETQNSWTGFRCVCVIKKV